MSQGGTGNRRLRPPVVLSLSHAEAAEKYLFAASCNEAININKYFRIFVLIDSAIVLQSWEQNDSGDVGYMEQGTFNTMTYGGGSSQTTVRVGFF